MRDALRVERAFVGADLGEGRGVEGEGDREIVRAEGPERRAVAASGRRRRAASGDDMAGGADGASVGELEQAHHGGVVAQQVPDEGWAAFVVGESDEGFGGADVGGQRLLAEQSEPGREGLGSEVGVGAGRAGDDDSVGADREGLAERSKGEGRGGAGAGGLAGRLARVDDGRKLGERVRDERAQDVRAPGPRPDEHAAQGGRRHSANFPSLRKRP